MTEGQKKWLLKLWEAHTYRGAGSNWLSVSIDKPPTVIMRALERKGYVKDIMGTFWKITPEGLDAAKTIY